MVDDEPESPEQTSDDRDDETWELSLPATFLFGPPPSSWPERPTSFEEDLARFEPRACSLNSGVEELGRSVPRDLLDHPAG